MIKRVLKIVLPLVLVLPILLYVAIVLINNTIAADIEKALKDYALPAETAVVKSVSAARKLMGSGNGMQYMGALLVSSNLTEQELKAHYAEFAFVEVKPQTSYELEFDTATVSFGGSHFGDDPGEYYAIVCWDAERSKWYNDDIAEWLDLDIRGH